MKNTLFLTTIVVLTLNYSPFTDSEREHISQDVKKTDRENAMNEKQLRHVVLIKFKENTTEDDITKVERAFSELPEKIPAISNYEWGINNSPEGLNKGFTHCFFVTFESEKDRSAYLPHPEHQAFVKILEPHLDDVLVIDYWAKAN